MKSSAVIVTRHKAVPEWPASQWGYRVAYSDADGSPTRLCLMGEPDERGVRPVLSNIPVLWQKNATPKDVQGKVVYGNVPLDLAALCECVCPVLFKGNPPRGAEYTKDDMVQAQAYLGYYAVLELPLGSKKSEYLKGLI
jgi:hypothetical protein